MNTTLTQTEKLEPQGRPAARVHPQPDALLLDPTAAATRSDVLAGDDESRTPPHGEAVLPSRTALQSR